MNCFTLSILWFARFPALEKVHFGSFEFRLAPCNISSVLIGTRDQKPLCIFFRELTRVHTWGKPKGKQKWLSCNRSGCLLTLLPILFFFFFTFQEVTWVKMWIRRRWPNSINRWPRWWTPGSSNKWVRVQCDQPEFFNKFLCMKTFLLQWNSLLQLHHSYADNYAVVALSKIRPKIAVVHTGKRSILLSQTVAQFCFRRYLPDDRSKITLPLLLVYDKFRFCCFRWQFDFIFRRNPGPPVHDASVPTRRGRSCEWVKKIINSQPASTIQNFFNSCFVSNTISYITLASRSNQLQQHRALY